MRFSKTVSEGVHLLEPKVFKDERAGFHEAYRRVKVLLETDLKFQVAQVNTPISNEGVLSCVYFKKYPTRQAKFVSVKQVNILYE